MSRRALPPPQTTLPWSPGGSAGVLALSSCGHCASPLGHMGIPGTQCLPPTVRPLSPLFARQPGLGLTVPASGASARTGGTDGKCPVPQPTAELGRSSLLLLPSRIHLTNIPHETLL